MPKDQFAILPNNAKSNIISLLSDNTNLNAKQIHSQLQRRYAIKGTYQATHKTLTQMLTEGILTKEKAVYSLNPAWIENYKKNAEQIAEKVKTGQKEVYLEDLKEGETIHLQFKGILEVGWFLVNKIMVAPNPNKTPGIALWRFCYSIVGLEEKHLQGMTQGFKKNKWYVFVEEANKLDRIFGDALLEYGLKEIKYGVKSSTPLSDKVIIGDFTAEIIYPSFFRNLWAIQNRLPQKILDFKLAKHLLLMREIQPIINIIITKNSKLANEYRQEYLPNKIIKKVH
jgi:hypothetical protein